MPDKSIEPLAEPIAVIDIQVRLKFLFLFQELKQLRRARLVAQDDLVAQRLPGFLLLNQSITKYLGYRNLNSK